MTAQEIIGIIDKSIAERQTFKNVLNLQRCRVIPELTDFYSSTEDTKPEKLWLVLEEDPEHHSGYSIVYDESIAAFGLATPGTCGKRIAISFHGSFCDALEAM